MKKPPSKMRRKIVCGGGGSIAFVEVRKPSSIRFVYFAVGWSGEIQAHVSLTRGQARRLARALARAANLATRP